MDLKSITQAVKLTDAPPEIVKAVQQQLVRIDLLDGAVDGIAGPATVSAFGKFKQLEYLGSPELLGPTTVKALLESTEDHVAPEDTYTPITGERPAVLPIVGKVFSSQPIYPNSNFTWGEATKCLSRVPYKPIEVQNIIKVARHLDKIRDFLGDRSITINSWFRPPVVNRAVGGVSNSRHLYGDAVDFMVEGITAWQVYDRLNEWHGKHGGLGKARTFTHLDCRGYCSRFFYSNK